MALGSFFVGQTPGEPALVTVTTPDGLERDLTGYTATGVMYAPDGTGNEEGVTQITDATAGLIQYNFPVPTFFDVPGIYLIQFELTNADPDVLDFTTIIEVEVLAALAPDVTDARVTTEQVFTNTGVAVSAADILVSQSEIGLVVGFDLASTDWDDLSASDQRWLQLAICHQAAQHASGNGDGTYRPAGATRVKAGSVEVTYGPGGSPVEELLAPLARMAISNLSWQGYRTIHPAPFLTSVPRQPDSRLWVEVS